MDILSPLIGKTVHHVAVDVANSQDFVKRITNERVEEDEQLRSDDVTALFTSVTVDKDLSIIQARVEDNISVKELVFQRNKLLNFLK